MSLASAAMSAGSSTQTAVAERCAAFAYKGCKLAAVGDFETVVPSEDPTRQPGFLIKASDVEVLSPRKAREAAGAIDAARANQEAAACGMPESEIVA